VVFFNLREVLESDKIKQTSQVLETWQVLGQEAFYIEGLIKLLPPETVV
jgi:hypothetical protein